MSVVRRRRVSTFCARGGACGRLLLPFLCSAGEGEILGTFRSGLLDLEPVEPARRGLARSWLCP